MRQWGVIARRQLVALGLTAGAIEKRIATGHLYIFYRGAYAVGHRVVPREGRYLAAALSCGPGAAVSHRSAAALHELASSSAKVVDVAVPARRRAQPNLRLHHPRDLTPGDITTVRGVPVTTAMRTLADLAATPDAAGLDRAIRQAERLRLLDMRALEPYLRRGRAGTANLRTALAAFDEGAITREELERRMLALVKQAKLPPPQCNVPVDRFVVDFLWPHHGLVLETDGWQDHGTRSAFENDRARDVVLAQHGLRVVRFTWRQLQREPRAVATALGALLAATPASAAAR